MIMRFKTLHKLLGILLVTTYCRCLVIGIRRGRGWCVWVTCRITPFGKPISNLILMCDNITKLRFIHILSTNFLAESGRTRTVLDLIGAIHCQLTIEKVSNFIRHITIRHLISLCGATRRGYGDITTITVIFRVSGVTRRINSTQFLRCICDKPIDLQIVHLVNRTKPK